MAEVKKETLKKVLDIVKPGLAFKEIIEQTTSFTFLNGYVITYNDEICIKCPIEIDVNLKGAIRAEDFYKFLGKVKKEDITLLIDDTKVIMQSGRAKAEFALKKEILLPLEEEFGEEKSIKWHTLSPEALEAMKFASEICSTDMTNPKLTCIHISNKGHVESTDNYRMVVWKLSEVPTIKGILIPALSVKEIVRLKPTHVSKGDSWVYFKNKQGVSIYCRVFNEEFVDIQGIVNEKRKYKKIIFPKGMYEIIERAEIISQQQKKEENIENLVVTVKSNKIIVESGSSLSKFREVVPFKWSGNEFSFIITPYLLKDILKETFECNISDTVLKFQRDNWVYISSLQNYEE